MTDLNPHGGYVGDWKASRIGCRKCGKKQVVFRVWESSCGGYEDAHCKCNACGESWWVEGPDS